MAMLSLSNPQNAFRNRLHAYIANRAENMQRAKVYRTTVTELGALSDRELGDLGLSRGSIRNVALEAAYGK